MAERGYQDKMECKAVLSADQMMEMVALGSIMMLQIFNVKYCRWSVFVGSQGLHVVPASVPHPPYCGLEPRPSRPFLCPTLSILVLCVPTLRSL